MFGKSCYADNNELLNRMFDHKKALIALHRGVWGGNIVENTAIAFGLAAEMGADMFECDVSRSTDGVLYSFHDSNEKRLLGINENIETLPSEKIDELIYLNSIYQPSGMHIERFEHIVSDFNNEELYNVDRAWDKLPETVSVLERYPASIRQALIKSPVMDDVLDFLNGYPKKYMYMPIVYNMNEAEKVLSYSGINLVGMELIAKTPESEMFQNENIKYLHDRGLFTWANAITLSGKAKHILFGGLDDDSAILKGGAAWGKMFEKGIDIIQTDWPVQLKKYRDSYFGLS